MDTFYYFFFFFSSRRRHTRLQGDWSSDVCSSDLLRGDPLQPAGEESHRVRGRRGPVAGPQPHRRRAPPVRPAPRGGRQRRGEFPEPPGQPPGCPPPCPLLSLEKGAPRGRPGEQNTR